MEKILVSACLLGHKVRYNGSDKTIDGHIWDTWQSEGRLVPVCPELSAGLSVPRPPAEIQGTGGQAVLGNQARVVERGGADVTSLFLEGAQRALELAREHQIRIAVLTDGSPSCGSTHIHDGKFAGQTRNGAGVTAAVLANHGVKIFSQEQLALAEAYLQTLEEGDLP